MRGWLAAGFCSCALVACLRTESESNAIALREARDFLNDTSARRAAMEASIARYPNTPYAQQRLGHYATGNTTTTLQDWDQLPVYEVATRPLRVRDVGSDEPYTSLPSADTAGTIADWRTLGALAFERYPAQIDLGLSRLRDRNEALRAGFEISADGVVRGVVEVEQPSGQSYAALTCAACHSAIRNGRVIAGLANERINLAEIFSPGNPLLWPVGTMDVTSDGIDNPQRPSDLRPIAHQQRLHQSGNLTNNPLARMVRIDSLLMSQLNFVQRPDRYVVVALALYLDSLSEALIGPLPDLQHPGAVAFLQHCASCHGTDARGGDVIDVSVVGTDPAATLLQSQRGTGGYRAPSLWGIGQRRSIVHDGSAANLSALLALEGQAPTGHGFGRTLTAETRAAIVAWLR